MAIDSGPVHLLSPETQACMERTIGALERVRLGGDELAICAVIDLNPPAISNEGQPISQIDAERLVVLDVGFRKTPDGKFGPYDIDGSGEKRLFEKPYVIVNSREEVDANDPTKNTKKTYIMEIEDDVMVKIGRSFPSAERLGFLSNPKISRYHAAIAFNKKGEITITDRGSSNGIRIQSAEEVIGRVDTDFGYTFNIADYVHAAGKEKGYKSASEAAGWGHGVFEGRPIIARDTKLNGGVYPVGGTRGEAIVVDDKEHPKELNQVYEKILEKSLKPRDDEASIKAVKRWVKSKFKGVEQGQITITNTLDDVLSVVKKTLRYDLKATKAIAVDSQEVALNEYIHKGVGVCRTQGVLSAYIVEKMINEGRLEGTVSIDRNTGKTFDGVAGGHAWARYRDAEGTVYIIDPAQGFVGRLQDATDRNWDYRRTEDHLGELLAA